MNTMASSQDSSDNPAVGHRRRSLGTDLALIGGSIVGPIVGEVALMFLFRATQRLEQIGWLSLPLLLLLGFVPLALRFKRDAYPIGVVYFPSMYAALMYLATPFHRVFFGDKY
jgi:hypothetical protein